ncbi:MAG: MFS transporter [Clostridia bacterium]|nr:MFS transporter [Clostridia bacterium]
MNLKEKATGLVTNVKTHWKTPAKGRYMPYKEIAAYSGGGIGAYMIITMGSACLLSSNNVLLSSALGIGPTDMYKMYLVAVVVNIFLTGIRANIIDNTRNKAGKYRPYIVTMAIPSAIACILTVWFPYNNLPLWLGEGTLFGSDIAYVAKCAIIMVLNLIIHFFYYFFYDAYENLIHVLSPNSQERTDVASIKSVVYSFAPTVVNLLTPIIAQHLFHTNTTDIRVYRFLYPILTVGGLLLCMIVYKHTEEKIVQARTHVVQIKFIDAIKAVAKNKYFWIISLAGWLGFLEASFLNILSWLYNYAGACSGTEYGIIITVYGNASLWGMILAPFCIRKWGKKAVLVATNIANIIFILMLLPLVEDVSSVLIWLVMGCMYLNALMGSFAHILNPAVQADIRDYQQYKTGERIDGMFATVSTIGTVLNLIFSAVLPVVYKKNGITEANAKLVTSNKEILDRVLGDGKTVGDILADQLANGQDNYSNPYSALYDPTILGELLHLLIILSAIGALMNVIPYFWYDFNEKKQESVIRVLKIRAMFEDYGNGILDDEKLVEGIDIIRNSQEMATQTPKVINKKDYKGKDGKKAYKEDVKYNNEIEISKFVCDELNKFSTPAYKLAFEENNKVYSAGLSSLLNFDEAAIKAEILSAMAMPKATEEEKETRKLALEIARQKMSSFKAIKKYFSNTGDLVAPDFEVLEKCFNDEDECDDKLKALYLDLQKAKKEKDASKKSSIKAEIKSVQNQKNLAKKATKEETDKHAYFNRAAKVYFDAEKLIKQKENYSHLDEIFKMYDEAKKRVELNA